MSVRVLKPGLLTSVQDTGRPGRAALGIGRAGALDTVATRLANALVGNAAHEAVLECTLVGPTLRFERAAVVACTGAPATLQADGHALPAWTACHLPAGSVLHLGGMRQGCRSYLAIGGGLAIPTVLGSRSDDLHARIGPHRGRALREGDTLALGPPVDLPGLPRGAGIEALRWGLDPQPWFDVAERPIALLPGSHRDALDAPSREQLLGARFTVHADSNRTGCRLDGPTLRLSQPLELVSEAALPGTVQLPPSGQPIVLMAEAPVTGGYPRIGQVAAVDLGRLAQRRPGDRLSFEPITLTRALQRLAERERALQRLAGHVRQRLESRR